MAQSETDTIKDLLLRISEETDDDKTLNRVHDALLGVAAEAKNTPLTDESVRELLLAMVTEIGSDLSFDLFKLDDVKQLPDRESKPDVLMSVLGKYPSDSYNIRVWLENGVWYVRYAKTPPEGNLRPII